MLTANDQKTVTDQREAGSIRLVAGHPTFSEGEEQDGKKETINNLLNHYYMKDFAGWESFMSELEFE